MTSDSESRAGGVATTARGHLRRWGRAYAWFGMFGLAWLFFDGVLGVRGLGPAGVALGEAAEQLAPTAVSALKSPHPFPELLAASIGSGLGVSTMATVQMLGLCSVAVAVPAVAGVAEKLEGRWSGVAAAILFASLPVVAGAATAFGTAGLFLGPWALFLRLLVVERHCWYDSLGLWGLGAALLLTWPPFAFWGAVWMYLELREAESGESDPDRLGGEFGRADLPVGIALAPFGVALAATLLHPALLTDPIAGWKAFGRFASEWTGPAFTYAGESYAESRPPPWTGAILIWWTIPAVPLLAAVGGWIRAALSERPDSRAARLARQMILWGLPLSTGLPWLHRGPDWGHVPFTAVSAPLIAVAAGAAIGRSLKAVADLAADRLGRAASLAAPSFAGLLLGGLLVATTVSSHPAEGSYYSPLAGGLEGAIDRGLPVSRDEVYPVQVMRRARARSGADSMIAIAEHGLVRQYVGLGLLEGVNPVETPGTADIGIRRIGRFRTGSTASLENPRSLVDLTRGGEPLMHIDGLPLYWMERLRAEEPGEESSTP